ncbi:MAG TPA: Wzz/FepE/Etk N-terminal domain-containing protein, partial [Burkholderiaceae bacterium]|nr:Wzz/FepE/Etk N-terminal domain-containing protein [Burkholderiaceae bacterium]
MNDTPMLPARPSSSDAWITQPQEERGMRDAAITLREQAPLALAVFLFVLLIGAAYTLFSTPIYRADTLVQVEAQTGTALAPSGIAGVTTVVPSSPAGLQGEIEILKSRELLLKSIAQARADLHVEVANRFPLVGNWLARVHEQRSLALASAPLGLGQFAWGGERIDLKTFDVPEAAYGQTFKLVTTQDGWKLYDEVETPVAEGRFGQATNFKLGDMPARVEVTSVVGRPGTSFEIRRDSPLITLENLLEQLKVTETTRQSGVIRATYEHPNREFAIRLLDRIGNNYVERAAERRAIEAEKSLKFLEEQIPVVMRELSKAEEKLSSFRVKTGTVDVEEETRSSFFRLNQLERDRVDLQVRRRQLSQRFEDNHPEIRAIDQQLAVIGNAINQLNGSVNNLPNSQRDYLRLQRDVNTNAQLY